MYGLKRIAAPTAEPVTLRQAKQQLAINPNEDAEDVRLSRLVKVAREKVERYTGYCCCPQTWQITLDDWIREIWLPRYPVYNVTTFQGRDPDNVWQDAAPTDYELDQTSLVPRIRVLPRDAPPLHPEYKPLVRINFECGHAAVADIPHDLQAAILRQIEDEDRFRGLAEHGDITESITGLLEPFKVPDEFRQYDRGEYAGLSS